jgi:hypothetical protein
MKALDRVIIIFVGYNYNGVKQVVFALLLGHLYNNVHAVHPQVWT